jgi:hypothetical protein
MYAPYCPLSTVSLCNFELRASGWTLSLNKKIYLRRSQQAMVTMSKQVGSTFRLFYPLTHRGRRCSSRRLCPSRMRGICSTWSATSLSQIADCRPDGLLLGARGTSVLFSSGDGGVGDGNPDATTQTCITNDGKNRTKFIANFPASCPL